MILKQHFARARPKKYVEWAPDIPENGIKQYMSWTRRRHQRVAAMTGVSDDGFQVGVESEISSAPGSGVLTSAH